MDNNTRHTNGEEQDPGMLNSINRDNVFHTPADYFEKLPVAVSDRIHAGKGTIPVRGWLAARLTAAAGVTVMAAIIISVYFFTNKPEKLSEPVITCDELLNSGVVADLSETMLFEELDARDGELQITGDNAVEGENIKEYLLENNTDISLIINEL